MDQFEGCSVVFHNVSEWYSPKNPIRCQFSVKETSSLLKDCTSDCFIGIFPVGWDNLLSIIIKKSFTIVEFIRKNNLYQIEFLDHELPETYNDDEFYQFCFYNIKTEHVYGASCPFQIYENSDSIETFVVCGNTTSLNVKHKAKVPLNGTSIERNENGDAANWMRDPYVEMDVKDGCDDDLGSFMVVIKQESIQGDLDKVKKEKELLLKNMKHESQQFTTQVQKLQHEAETKKQEFHKKLLELADVKRKLEESISENEKLAAVRTKTNLEKNFLQTELQTLQEQEEKVKSKNNELRNEILVLKQTIRKSEEKQKAAEDQNQRLLTNYQAATEEQGKVQEETKMIEKQLSDVMIKLKLEQQKNECLHVDLDNASNAVEIIKLEKDEMKTVFLAKENLLSTQVNDLIELNSDLQTELNELDKNINSMADKEVQSNLENDELKKMISENEKQHGEALCNLQELIDKQDDIIVSRDNRIELLEKEQEEQVNVILNLNHKIEQKFANEQKCNDQEEIILILQSKIKKLESNLHEQQQNVKSSSTSKPEHGPLQALQVAYGSLHEQLKQLKQENGKLKQGFHDRIEKMDSQLIIKENGELKLRLCMAKKAYEKKHREWNILKEELAVISAKDTSTSFDQDSIVEGLNKQIEILTTDLSKTRAELENSQDEIIHLEQRIEEFKEKSKTLAQHYEGKFKLLEEENTLLKKQQCQPITEVFEKQSVPGGVPKSTKPRSSIKADSLEGNSICLPPSHLQKERHHMQTQKYQHPVASKPDIAYPPSMNMINHEQKNAWLPAVVTDSSCQAVEPSQQQCRQLRSYAPSYPPTNQLIANREPIHQRQICTAPIARHEAPVQSLTLHGRGRPNKPFMQEPTQRCPVCNFTFPPGFTDVSASAHVNQHFSSGNV